jgi:hypothetical protein
MTHPRIERSGTWRRAPRVGRRILRLSGPLVALITASVVTGTSASGTPGPAPSTSPPVIHGVSPDTKTVNGVTTSHNWAGYAVTGTTFIDVQASWIQPTVSCPTPTKKLEASAFWVGIDGFSAKDDTVEQTGTDSDCDAGPKKGAGIPTYYAWWEMDTASSSRSTTILDPVSPGDQMTADVSNSGGTYILTLTDSGPTNRWTYSPGSITPSTAPKASSAEWIAEAPSVCNGNGKCSILKLADFGSVTFTGAAANDTSVSSFSNSQTSRINMVKGKTTLASTSALSGSEFSIDWEHD